MTLSDYEELTSLLIHKKAQQLLAINFTVHQQRNVIDF